MVFTFGRLVTSVGEAILPPHLGANIQNVDIKQPGEASRRKGFVHAIESAFTGEISLVAKFTDHDGEECFIVVDEDGINRAT